MIFKQISGLDDLFHGFWTVELDSSRIQAVRPQIIVP